MDAVEGLVWGELLKTGWTEVKKPYKRQAKTTCSFNLSEALATYDPPNSKVAEAILERGSCDNHASVCPQGDREEIMYLARRQVVIARLTHGNSAATGSVPVISGW